MSNIVYDNQQLAAGELAVDCKWFNVAISESNCPGRVVLLFQEPKPYVDHKGLTCAYDREFNVIGAHLYLVTGVDSMYSICTWVYPKYRRGCVALNMWSVSLAAHEIKSVTIVVCTPSGLRMIKSVHEHNLEVAFDIQENLYGVTKWK